MVTMVEPGSNWVDPSLCEVGLVPKELVPVVWPLVEPILQVKGKKWLETVSEAEVFGWLVEGKADLWMAAQNQIVDGFVIGSWEVHDRKKRYCVVFIAGEGLEKYIRQGLEKLEQFCSILGGSELVLEGRKGWVRWLKKYGYHQDTVKLRKTTSVMWRH